MRLKRVCYGWRDDGDLIFRVENGSSGKLPKSESWSTKAVGGVRLHDLHDTQGEKKPQYTLHGIPRSLFPSKDDQTLCYFYDFMIGTTAESDHSRYLHLQLPALLSRSRQDSALYLAAQAISHAVVCHFSVI